MLNILEKSGFWLGVALLATLPVFAEEPPGPSLQGEHIKAHLVSEVATASRGASFDVGVRFDMDEHWHVYWKNPGDSGIQLKVNYTLPDGVSAGEIRWPVPDRLPLEHLMNFGYEGSVLLTSTLDVPDDFPAETLNVVADIEWLVCKVECIPGWGRLALSVPVGNAPSVIDTARQSEFDQSRFAVPVSSDALGWRVEAGEASDEIVLRLTPPAAVDPGDFLFYPDEQEVIDNPSEQKTRRIGEQFEIRVARSAVSDTVPERLRGVLVSPQGWRGAGSEPGLAFDVPLTLTKAELALPAPSTTTAGGFLFALVGALFGGLILNLMPCVLPILSLKVLGFVESARDESGQARSGFGHALLFAAGVIVSFWALAGALLALRGVGHELGWGFQLQSPPVVIALSALFLLLGLNLFGVFEIGSGLASLGGVASKKKGGTGAFLSGVLATIVATPCTAPFMGAALGYALSQSAVVSLAIFTALGVGMAAPYVILASSPRLLRWVPRPGAWMESLKQFLGFLLIATVIWLVWVFGHQVSPSGEVLGVNGITQLLAGLLVVSAGAWVLGRWGVPAKPVVQRWTARVVMVALLAAGVLFPMRTLRAETKGPEWQDFSPALIDQLEADGTPYLIDFTASWCLSCQVNKAVALDRRAVTEALETRGIVAVKADWTNKDDVIAEALAEYDRYSVPLYVLHPGGGQTKAEVLPNILTEGIVLEAISNLPE